MPKKGTIWPKTFLIILLSAGIVFGCKKELGEFLLGSYKAYNPFKGNETLVYKHSVSDSVFIFYGDGRYSELFEYVPTNNPTIDYWVNEKNLCSFTTEDERYTLRIDMSTHWYASVEMYLVYNEQVRIDTLYRRIVTYYLPITKDAYTPQPSPYSHRFYYDSLQIFDKYYTEVYADSSLLGGFLYHQYHLTPEVQPTAIYYTKTEGIIRIDFDDDSYWGLTEIISP